MSDRERVEAEAREWYPDGQADEAVRINELRAAFIAGRSVTDEQVERAMEAIHGEDAFPGTPEKWEGVSATERRYYRRVARAALTAAGFYVEGEE